MLKLKKFPDTLLILLGILVVFIILTWLMPAGEFDRTEMNGRMVVVPGSYTSVAPAPQGIGAFFMAPIRGFVGAAQIIAFVFLVGGAFAILNRTGAVDAGLQQVVRSSQRRPGLRKWVIPVVMVLFSLCGATFGMSEEVLVFVLITIPLSIALGYDTIVGVAISFVGAGAGFAGAFLNPFTIGIAQGIAELAPFSGMGYRLVAWVVMTLIAILFVMRYARKIAKDPSKSPVNSRGQTERFPEGKIKNIPFTAARKFILLLLLAALIVLIFWRHRMALVHRRNHRAVHRSRRGGRNPWTLVKRRSRQGFSSRGQGHVGSCTGHSFGQRAHRGSFRRENH